MTLPIILVLISILGLLLVAILASRLYALDTFKKVRRHRSKEEGLIDLLQYATMIDDGIIACKNGSLLAAWEYVGADQSYSTDAEKELVSYRINQVLNRLGAGWAIHVDAIRQPSPDYPPAGVNHFPDRVSYAMDEERRRLFNSLGTLYEGKFIITVTYLPPTVNEQKFFEMMFDDDSEAPVDRTAGLLSQFKNELRNIESGLSACFNLRRLKGVRKVSEDGKEYIDDEFLAHLQFCITGMKQPVQLPKNPVYLDAVIGGQEMYGGIIPKIGRKYIQVVAIEGFPQSSVPGILTALGELNIEYRWSSRYIFLDQHEAINLYDKYRKRWKQKQRGLIAQMFNPMSTNVDEDAVNMTVDAQQAKAETSSGAVSQGYYSSVVVIMDESRDRLEHLSLEVQKLINKIGFTARIETVNTMDAYVGSLPGHVFENVRRPVVNSLNVADLLPTSSIWTGNPKCPCPFYPPDSPALMKGITVGHAPLNINFHVNDVGHTFCVGPTGSGKSTLIATAVSQARRYRNMRIYAFDKGRSLFPLTLAVGGQHFSVAADEQSQGFAPLQYLDTSDDRAWAMGFIENILLLNNVQVTPAMRNEIGNAIFDMHESKKVTFSDFMLSIQNETIREALKQYTIGGNMGYLLDAKSDDLRISNFACFEIEDLMNLEQKYAMPVLLYLFRRIEVELQKGENRGNPAMLFLDEAWLMLSHPAFREKIREWLKVLRRANCLVFMATQSLADALKSGIMDVLISETATKIFLPNAAALGEANKPFYLQFGLNEKQIEIVAQAQPKREYYFFNADGCRLFNLALQPLQLAFVGASDRQSLKEIDNLYASYGDEWVDRYLSLKGLNLSDYIPEHVTFKKTNAELIDL